MLALSPQSEAHTPEAAQTPPLAVAFGLSVLVHAFLVVMPISPRLLHIATLHTQNTQISLRLAPARIQATAPLAARSAAPAVKITPPRAQPAKQKTRPRAARPPSTAAQIASQPALRPAPDLPASPAANTTALSAPSAAQSETEGIATASNAPALEPQLQVKEIYPEEAAAPIDIVDPSYVWHDLSSLWKRPLVLNAPELVVPGISELPVDTPAVQICIRINADGSIQGIQTLTPPTQLAELIVHALTPLHFSPGEDKPGNAVSSLLILEFSLSH